MSDHDHSKLLGLTKSQFWACIVALLIACIACNVWDTYRIGQLADQGAKSHAAVCAYRGQLTQSLSDNVAYLRMTPAERAQKFGAGLARIPRATILKAISQERAVIHSLDPAGCQ